MSNSTKNSGFPTPGFPTFLSIHLRVPSSQQLITPHVRSPRSLQQQKQEHLLTASPSLPTQRLQVFLHHLLHAAFGPKTLVVMVQDGFRPLNPNGANGNRSTTP